MFAKNVFGSHLESIICKTINVRAPVRHARQHSPSCPLFPSAFIPAQGNGQRGVPMSLTRKIAIIINLIYY